MTVISDQDATLANVSDSASSAPIFAASAGAKGRCVFNDSTQVLYLKFGGTASTTSYTVQIPAGGFYEFPQPVYGGAVDGIWAADGSGAARTTEW